MKRPASVEYACTIDIHEDEKIDEAALKALIRAAVALNLKDKSRPKLRRAGRKRVG